MSNNIVYFNGIDGMTGDYLWKPMERNEFAARIRGSEPGERIRKPRELKAGLHPANLADGGWGAIFAEGSPPAIKDALKPLLELRQAQAAQKHEYRYRELTYLPAETKNDFLARNGAGPGPVDPRNVPYYLLIVGGPEQIPYAFQYQLAVQYAVGRIAFDTPEEVAEYVRSVLAAERKEIPCSGRMAFFGVQNPDDEPTRISVDHLVRPLELRLADRRPQWRVETLLRHAAKKQQLTRLLDGEAPPALLFTASHAITFRAGTARQLPFQGALMCADWPGPRAWKGGRIPEDLFFGGLDIAADVRLPGLVSFHFACFTAGTPTTDSFARNTPAAIAPQPFVARLPQRLLRAGALAVVGHVDRAWEHSFLWDEAGSQVAVFESALYAITGGERVGRAMRYFGTRYAEIAVADFEARRGRRDVQQADDDFQLFRWTALNDARSYVIVGDPAVRLNVQAEGGSVHRGRGL